MRGVQTHRCIARPWAPRDKTDAGLAGEFAVSIRHVGRASFLAADDEFEFIFDIMQRIQHRQIRFAGHAKTDFSAVQY